MPSALRFSIIFFGLPLAHTPLALANIFNTFDHYDEGWTTYGDAPSLDWDPPGSIIAIDAEKGDYWGFSASPQYLGNHFDYTGGDLSWDLQVSALSDTDPAEPDVWLISSNLSLVIGIGDPDKGGDWVHRHVHLSPEIGWKVGSLAGPTTSDDQFIQVMSDLKEVRIRAEYSDGPDYAWLDNVVMSRRDCYPDCDHDGAFTIFDFFCFLNTFSDGDEYADCTGDGVLDLFDFLCYTNAFNAGC